MNAKHVCIQIDWPFFWFPGAKLTHILWTVEMAAQVTPTWTPNNRWFNDKQYICRDQVATCTGGVSQNTSNDKGMNITIRSPWIQNVQHESTWSIWPSRKLIVSDSLCAVQRTIEGQLIQQVHWNLNMFLGFNINPINVNAQVDRRLACFFLPMLRSSW